MAPLDADTIVDRVHRVRGSLATQGDPRSVQATVDGPCPGCGARFVVDVRADLDSIECPGCSGVFGV